MLRKNAVYSGWDFTNVWDIQEGQTVAYLRGMSIPSKVYEIVLQYLRYSGGIGTASDPYIITTEDQLNGIREEPTAYYKLGADITLTKFQSGSGWTPIPEFTGQLDGNGHKISNLYINRPSTGCVGLFSQLNSSTTIKNLSLVNVNITGSTYTGAIAGYSNSTLTLSGVSVTGSVTGGQLTGGLIGYSSYSITIVNSYSSANIASTSIQVGGLVGYAVGNINITNAYSTGNVNSTATSSSDTSYSYIGGLIGYIRPTNNTSKIEKTYASGNVSAGSASAVGGLVGYVDYNSSSSSYKLAINNSYAIGQVTGKYNVGGLIGCSNYATLTNTYAAGKVIVNSSGVGGLVATSTYSTVTNSYWDTTTTTRTSSALGTGKTTAQMHQQTTFNDWNFSTVWKITEGSSYPSFK